MDPIATADSRARCGRSAAVDARRETPDCPRPTAGENARPINRLASGDMEHDAPSHPPALSLQHKLDRIARERDVLALMGELARAGLREGDAVRHIATGAIGRLWIDRDGEPPSAFVVTEDGGREPYSAGRWLPA
jgi:hypothetical protein